ncbi:MAG: phosphoribosyltransferase family protein [Chloroflexota bacterium]
MLQAVVTLRLDGPFRVAIALDRYKDPTTSEDSYLWKNTPIGQLFHDAKYGGDTAAGKALARELHAFISTHPDYASAEAIVAVPSHTPARFSERLARAVGRMSALPVVVSDEAAGEGRAVKGLDDGERAVQLFRLDPNAVHGKQVIVMDDMVRSGRTLVAVGEAASNAGAARVVGLAAVRTMRN